MCDRGRQTRQTFCSSSLLSPFLFCFAQPFFSSSVLTSVTLLSALHVIFVSLLVSSSSTTATTNICEIARFTYHLFLCCVEREGVGLTEDVAKGNKLGWVVWFILCTSDVPQAPVLLFVVECRETMQENCAGMYGIVGTFRC
jgi:hypothetical protein